MKNKIIKPFSAGSITHTENGKNMWPWHLTYDLGMNSIGFERLSRYMCVQHLIKYSVHELSTAHYISDNSKLRSRFANISWTHQAIDKRKTALATTIFSHVRWKKWWKNGRLTKKMTYTFDLWQPLGPRGCQGTCFCKISSSWVQRFTSYLA